MVLIGDGAVGKSSLLVSYSTSKFPTEYVPTVFDNYILNILVGGFQYTLGLFDTSGQEDYDRLRPLSYPQTDVYIVCGAVPNPDTFDNLPAKWIPEARHHSPGVPIVMAGLQKDLRDTEGTNERLKRRGQKPWKFEDGVELAKKLKATSYVECSALTGDGVKALFEEAIRAALECDTGEVKKERKKINIVKSLRNAYRRYNSNNSTTISSTSNTPPETPPAHYDFEHLYTKVHRTKPPTNGPMDWSPYIKKADKYCIGGGRFGDVYRGNFGSLKKNSKNPPPMVAIKVLRPVPAYQRKEGQKALKRLQRELAVWQRLKHDNVVPFVGISNSFGEIPSLISLWMENGTVTVYLEAHPKADRLKINLGISRGLEYLHSQDPEVIHGDLKAVNILVDAHGRPCLTDFGLSRIDDDSTLWVTTATSAPGSIRWMSPELLAGTVTTVNRATDVYGYAMTSLEIVTGKVPFAQYSKDGAVLAGIVNRKEIPPRPTEVSEAIWALWRACWSQDADHRPDIEAVTTIMQGEYDLKAV